MRLISIVKPLLALFSPLVVIFSLYFPINVAEAHRLTHRVKDSGDIKGIVKDSSGASVSQATVELTNSQQLSIRRTETDGSGEFRLEGVKSGSYVIHVLRFGFVTLREVVHVTAGGTVELDMVLGAGQLNEQVTVTAETGSAQEKERVPQQVNVIPEGSVTQRTTAVLAQVADEEVGISLQRTSPTIGAVLVRGLTEVGVYVDGVRYTNSTQRGGINTFFNLNEPTGLSSVEVLRGPNTAQYGSDSLGGTVQLITRQPNFGHKQSKLHGESNTSFNSADRSFGGNMLLNYGAERFGVLANLYGRRINNLRPGGGIDSHSAITRFLGLPSDIAGVSRPSDTAFTQYGGTMKMTFAPAADQSIGLHYQRAQQDGGKRYDQLLGGDGNLVADLRNLMLDFIYARYFNHDVGIFDNFSATFSYNSQREERVNQGGNGNPLAAITHDRERTSSHGFNFYFDKRLANRNNLLIGGDYYHDRVNAPSYSLDPASGIFTTTRPRVPDGARYILAGLYAQDAFDAIPNRLRLSGALRYNVGSYRSRAANSPLVDGQPLFPDDSLRVGDFSGRIGASVTLTRGFNLAFNFSRGFRAPNITSLGSVGLVGVGYQVAASDLQGLGALIGSTADDSAVSTGVNVQPLKSETSNNYDVSLRYNSRRLQTEITGFIINYDNTIVRQTLILPPGAVGQRLGSQVIESQNENGAVFVPLSLAPVLVQANFSATRLSGVEYSLNYRLTNSWSFNGNYTFIRAEERETGLPPNLGGGGIPPQLGFVSVRYQPDGRKYWIETYSTLAGKQDRLSSLDISDRRTGAVRSRANIQNFFRRGACVYGLTTPGSSGQCGSGGGRLIATGETLDQVQNRVLGSADSAPLFSAIPGYGLINLRGGMRIGESQDVMIDFENIADKSYRAPGWGIDGPGRSVTIRYRYRF
jgi:hemoglobin/transferrin/lactoferrin receptor protein